MEFYNFRKNCKTIAKAGILQHNKKQKKKIQKNLKKSEMVACQLLLLFIVITIITIVNVISVSLFKKELNTSFILIGKIRIFKIFEIL